MVILYEMRNIFQSDNFLIYSVSLHEARHGYASWMRPVAMNARCGWRESLHYKAQDWSEL